MDILLIAIIASMGLSLSRILLARLSQSNYFLSTPADWVRSSNKLLKFSDELLAVSSFLFSSYILFFLLSAKEENYFITALIIASLLYCVIAWVGLVLMIGNMVYPVNGIKMLKASELPTALLQIYARLHLADLALGILTISLSTLSPNVYITLSGCLAGVLQMVFTYYGKPINYKAHVMSVIAWAIWLILFQIMY